VKSLVLLAGLSSGILSAGLRADAGYDAGLAAEQKGDSATALKYFLQADRAKPNDPKIQQHLARQYADLSDFQPSSEQKKEFADQALRYSELAAKLEPNNAEHVLSLAISYGKLANFGDNRTKVRYAGLIKQEAEEAARLDPKYGLAHYVLGRWNYEVAKINHPAQFFVKLFYGGMPPGSNDVAIHELTLATELDPTEPAPWIDLGFAYAAAGKTDEARKSWEKGMQLPAMRRDQIEAKDRGKAALARN
jgi:Flp pilus assembly protein TadD